MDAARLTSVALATLALPSLVSASDAALAAGAESPPKPVELSAATTFDVNVDGTHVHFIGFGDDGLVYRNSEDGGERWSDAVRIDPFIEEAKRPRGHEVRIATSGDRLLALWETKGEWFKGSGPLVTAVSNDGGKTWTQGPSPVPEGVSQAQAFLDLAGDERGFHLVWIDSRGGPDGFARGLRYVHSKDGKTWNESVAIDSVTCECCWNKLAFSDGEMFVLYRDKEPRDMAFASSSDGGKTFERQGWVGEFGWELDGCPHVGGGLAVMDDVVHTTVWTGRQSKAGIYYLRSDDGGASWTRPRRLGSESAKNTDLAAAEGRVAVAWDTTEGGRGVVRWSLSDDEGETWSEPVDLPDRPVSYHHPRIVAVPGGFLVVTLASSTEDGGSSVISQRVLANS